MNPLYKLAGTAALLLPLAIGARASEWLTSYPEALKLSKKTGKPVMVDFTGSDWCIYCKKLEAEVFTKPEFKKWADKYVILLKLDYPQVGPKSPQERAIKADLLHKYNVKGFPTILFLKANGKPFGQYGYDLGGPVHWTTMADRLVNPNSRTVSSRPLRFAKKDSGYPAPVAKNLYANNDFRGKTAPKLMVQKWVIGAAPETKGKVVLVDFWATWCPPCRELIPELAQWQKKYAKDLVVIGVTDESSDTIKKFMKTTPIPYSVAIDANNTTSSLLGIRGIPHVLIVTPDHIVRWQGFPGSDEEPLTDKILEQIIRTSKSQTSTGAHQVSH